jgi:hypothetical protein
MEAREVSARFAAYAWYRGRKPGRPPAEEEALRFAGESWDAFLPCAHEGLGKLLIRLARVRKASRRSQPDGPRLYGATAG